MHAQGHTLNLQSQRTGIVTNYLALMAYRLAVKLSKRADSAPESKWLQSSPLTRTDRIGRLSGCRKRTTSTVGRSGPENTISSVMLPKFARLSNATDSWP